MKFISSILLGFVFCNPLSNEYSNLDSILSKYVDTDGLVSYQAIIDNPYNNPVNDDLLNKDKYY